MFKLQLLKYNRYKLKYNFYNMSNIYIYVYLKTL